MGYHDPETIDQALSEIKDRAVMLIMASEFLCRDSFMKKLGAEIEAHTEVLEEDIAALQKQFVGKSLEKIELGPELVSIADIGKGLKAASPAFMERCADGELGRDLAAKVASLSEIIKALKERVQGEDVSYTVGEKAIGLLARFKFMVVAFVSTSRFTLKLAGIVVLAGLMFYSYLLFSMIKAENALEKAIRNDSVLVQASEKRVSNLDKKIKKVRETIRLMKRYESGREDKIEIMAMNVKEHELKEERNKAIVIRDLRKKSLRENKKKMKEMMSKSYLERLLGL